MAAGKYYVYQFHAFIGERGFDWVASEFKKHKIIIYMGSKVEDYGILA